MEDKNENEEISEFVKIFKSWEEDEQFQFYIEVSDIMSKFLNLENRDTRRIYYKNKYNNDEEWKKKHLERQKKYYHNKKNKLKNKKNEVIKEDGKETTV